MKLSTAETLIKTIALNSYVLTSTTPDGDYINIVNACAKYCKEHDIYLDDKAIIKQKNRG